ncbi:hypothetical protein [Actinomadura fibrosa]|uniref:Uncharacterized protein n=1 Tax=Actinomadura fibrosa TaxID=111802 RepID=A0ABW2XDL1_9ACTN|nr:hypothetical protein [Actinomadura fibrosa]
MVTLDAGSADGIETLGVIGGEEIRQCLVQDARDSMNRGPDG